MFDAGFGPLVVLVDQDLCLFYSLLADTLDELKQVRHLLPIQLVVPLLVPHELGVQREQAELHYLLENLFRMAQTQQLLTFNADLSELVKELLRPLPVLQAFQTTRIEQ